jgi:hypothetical protein
MSTVDDLFRSTAFDPETVELLCTAYDTAQKSLHNIGQPDVANLVIAECIISLAKRGERDPNKLCAGALKAFRNRAADPRFREGSGNVI